jgi:photosystem I subunit 10
MMQSLLLAAQQVDSIDNSGAVWAGTGTPIIITLASLIVLFIASRTIDRPHDGPKMPLGPLGPLFNNISVAGFIGAVSLGHILGTLVTLAIAR